MRRTDKEKRNSNIEVCREKQKERDNGIEKQRQIKQIQTKRKRKRKIDKGMEEVEDRQKDMKEQVIRK